MDMFVYIVIKIIFAHSRSGPTITMISETSVIWKEKKNYKFILYLK